MTTVTQGSSIGQLSTSRRLKNSAITVVLYAAFGVALIPLVWLSYTVISRGIDRFLIDENGDANFNLDFLQQSMRGVVGGAITGGALHAIWGTVLITLTATLISVPIGILTAVYVVEYGDGGRLKKAVTFF